MRGTIRKLVNGSYEVVVEAGRQSARRCLSCGRRAWLRDHTRDTCPRPRCEGTLGEARLERRQVSETYRTEREAERALSRHVNDRHKGRSFPGKTPFREYATAWIDGGGSRGQLRGQTAARYRDLLKRHVFPMLGDLPLEKIRSDDVRACFRHMTEKGLAPRTIMQARAIVRAVFGQAVADETLERNPVVSVKGPKVSKADVTVLRPEHVTAILAAAQDTPWEIPILLAGTTGARRSEVLAVRWSDVDLDRRTLNIRRSLQVRAERGPNGETTEFVEDTKSDGSRREIPLPSMTVERLRTWKAEQNARRLALGATWQDLDLVCSTMTGGPMYPDSMSAAFPRIAKAAGVPAGARLHDLRHAMAVMLGIEGVEIEAVAAILGHSTPAFTLSVYRHAINELTRPAADAVDRALGATVAVADGR